MNLMHDSAWDAVKHLDLKRVTEEGGTDVVLAAPDAFCGNAPDAARVEAIEDALYGTKAGKDITSFVSRVETKFHRFHDVANIVLHEVASGYILGGQLGITQERFREFMTFTSRSLEYDKIKSAIRHRKEVGKTKTVFAADAEQQIAAKGPEKEELAKGFAGVDSREQRR